MKVWLRYGFCIVAGLAIGAAGAAYTVRSATFGANLTIGPWATGTTLGTSSADIHTRAVVALKGLLALPAREARYYTAAHDSDGQPLDGRCTYQIKGGQLPGKWWSLTVYDSKGYLIANAQRRYSVTGAAFPQGGRGGWMVTLSPSPVPGAWLPSGGLRRLELTLRTYLPPDGGMGNPSNAVLPRIIKAGCP